jgi:CMP-N,N'-diacetyllegionaminic acid synthase
MINNKKIIAMVPARIGSKRIKKKNLRLIDKKPLISYILNTLTKISLFDEIYLNADDEVFGEIAEQYGVEFYHRDKKFSMDKSTNDEFALDFMSNVKGDILIQILPTSPLITKEEIENFIYHMVERNLETLISVEHKQIASLYDNNAINFNKHKQNPPSQEMTPIKAYATVLMGWEYNSFKRNMYKYNCAYHGGDSKTDYFQITGLSTIDIDNEEDFLLAESIILANKQRVISPIKYYGDSE